MQAWLDREIAGCEFSDAALGDRFRKLLAQIGSAMGQSIPLVCQNWANTKAAYRFFSNDRVSEEDTVLHRLFVRAPTALPIAGERTTPSSGVEGLDLHPLYRAMAWLGGKRPVNLSITHNFRPDDSTQPDVSEA
jgi:hypothetical protein